MTLTFFLTENVGRSMEYIVTQGCTEEDKGSSWIMYTSSYIIG